MDIESLGTTPVPGANPVGEDCRYDEAFQALQLLVNPNPNTPLPEKRWEAVVEASAAVLEKTSKDLTVTTYLVYGLLQTGGVPGLERGLKVLQGMMQTFWAKMYPSAKRMRGRKNALTWLYEKLVAYAEQYSDPPQPPALVESVRALLADIDSFCVEHMVDDAPIASPAQDAIGRIPLQSESSTAAPAATDAPSSTPAPASTSQTPPPPPRPSPSASSTPTEAIDSPASARRALGQGWGTIREAASWMRKNDPSDPLPYRLARMAAWHDVDQAPPATDGMTMIPAPDEAVVAALANLYDGGNWADLLEAAEGMVQRYLFWLDPHRYSFEALENLGVRCAAARDAVLQETVRFVQRVPGLVNLGFQDGPPFADPQTRAWLEEHAASGSESAAPGAGGGAREESMQPVLEEARRLAKEKKVAEALQLLDSHRKKAETGREAYLWRLGLCSILEGVRGGEGILDPHLGELIREIETYRLDTWEPSLALEGLQLAYRQWSRRKEAELKARAEEVFRLLARIDTAAAMAVKGA